MYKWAFLLLDAILDPYNSEKRGFNLARGFRKFSTRLAGFRAGTSWWKGAVKLSCLVHGGWEAEYGNNTRGEGDRE